ncbi:MAG: hypothetical protein JSW08_02520 [archaeon]|nr:MAG: hypothetical protein JSW08_02520 [archaeon]
MEKHHGLNELKKEYSKFVKKYKLPEFSELNKEFEIEKVQEKETEFLLREIRRAISEKIVAFLKFLELFMNPSGAPLFILISLKGLTHSKKEKIEHLYSELVKTELGSVSLDIEYQEKEEVRFIKECYKKWKEVKPDLHGIFKELEKIHSKGSEKKTKSYFG